MKGNIKSMRFYLLIFSFFIQLNIYCLNNRDTLFMSKNHFRYDRDYGLGFKYNHNFSPSNKNNFGVGYFLADKSWYSTLYEIYLNHDLLKETQLSFSFTKMNDKISESICLGVSINLNYSDKMSFSFSPKIGINIGALDITPYCNILPFDNFRYQNFGLGVTFRPQILRNFFRKGQVMNEHYLQYELNQMKKARKKGKVLFFK